MSEAARPEVSIRVEVLEHGEGLPLPQYETQGAAGLDLRAAVHEHLTLAPGQRALVPAGIRVAIPAGFEGQIRARSGLALRAGVGLPNAPGTIDSDYRGEVKVLMINWGERPFTIERGLRIAQLVIAPVAHARLERVDSLDRTDRAGGGFGHTGLT